MGTWLRGLLAAAVAVLLGAVLLSTLAQSGPLPVDRTPVILQDADPQQTDTTPSADPDPRASDRPSPERSPRPSPTPTASTPPPPPPDGDDDGGDDDDVRVVQPTPSRLDDDGHDDGPDGGDDGDDDGGDDGDTSQGGDD